MWEANIFQTDDNVLWQDIGKGIQRKILGHNDKLMLVKVKFETGAVGELHSHHHVQATYVQSGVFEFTIGHQKLVIKKGDGCFMPSNMPHGCVCLEAGILIDTFSPAREDFL